MNSLCRFPGIVKKFLFLCYQSLTANTGSVVPPVCPRRDGGRTAFNAGFVNTHFLYIITLLFYPNDITITTIQIKSCPLYIHCFYVPNF